jgi:hypothetical protein
MQTEEINMQLKTHTPDYFRIILSLMTYVERVKGMSGSQKKDYVLNILHKNINDETWAILRPIFDTFIEGFISLSKKDIRVFKKKVKKFCC